ENKSYDLLFLADYASNILANKGDLQEIDKSRIPVHHIIYPFLLEKDFDPKNKYTIPYMWECSGIAYDNRVIEEKDISLKLLFDSPYKKVTTGDPIETINLAAYHLFQDKNSLSKEEQEKITTCLKEQNSQVEAYAEFRAKDLVIGENVPVALIKTPFIKDLATENPAISFAFPKEAIFTSIENVVMLKEAQNVDNAYQFLRYIYKPENLAKTVERFPCFPASAKAFDYLEEDAAFIEIVDIVKKREKDMRFFYYILDKEEAHKIYIEAKS
ncbi:extracellular solute-binding protein, partial [bacterium]|nr:extracellular solute-binding protein [bacterium]